jgi:hypothetical protein
MKKVVTAVDVTDKLSRNVGKEWPLYTAQISSTLRRKLEITQSNCNLAFLTGEWLVYAVGSSKT